MTGPRVGVTVAPCGCRSWFCARCGPKQGIGLRNRLEERVAEWGEMLMLSLTVDPAAFGDPRRAWEFVRSRRCISRLMRELHRGGWLDDLRYFYVLEWQKNGFPHWHVLVRARYIPHHVISAKWNAMRPAEAGPAAADRPGLGFAWISKPRFHSALHAARYVTKYLTKNPEGGYPAWVMELGADARVRRYDVSRGFWGGSAADDDAEEATKAKRAPARLSYTERVRHCGETANVYEREERVDRGTGEVLQRWRWLGVLMLAREDIETIRADEERGHVRTWWGVGVGEALQRMGAGRSPPAWKSVRAAA